MENASAVDPQAREAEAVGALVERDARLALKRLGDGPLVVLAEEHHRRVVDAGEHERLVDVALARRAVAEVDHDGRVALEYAALGRGQLVALQVFGWLGWIIACALLLTRVPAVRRDPLLALPATLLLFQPQGYTNALCAIGLGNLWVLVVNAGVKNNAVTGFIGSTGFGVTAFQMFFFAGFAFVAAGAFGLCARSYRVVDHYRKA